MVYCGKASQGCQNCRTRRIKCDKVRPDCSQCIRVGKKCPGYRDQLSLMFRDESTKVIQKAHAQWGLSETGEGSKSASAQGPRSAVVASSSSSFSSTSPSAGSPAASTPSSAGVDTLIPIHFKSERRQVAEAKLSAVEMPQEVQATQADQGIRFYIQHYLIGHPDEAKTMQDLQGSMWLHAPHVADMMAAVGLASLSNLTGNKELDTIARQKYGSSLQQTVKAIQNLNADGNEALVRAVVMLAMWEVVRGNQEPSGSTRTHIMGAAALVKSMAPWTDPTDWFRGLLQLCFSMVPSILCSLQKMSPEPLLLIPRSQFVPCYISGITLPDAFFDMISSGEQACPPSDKPAADLILIMTRFVQLSAFVRAHALADGRPRTANVIREVQEIDAALSVWEHRQQSAGYGSGAEMWAFSVEGDAPGELDPFPRAAVFRGRFHAYSSMWAARVWNHYRWTRLMANQMILEATERFSRSAEALVSVADRARCLETTRRMSLDTMTSLPTHWRHPGLSHSHRNRIERTVGGAGIGAAGLPTLMFQIKSAACAPGVPYEHWDWGLEVLNTIWRDTGMLQAKALADITRSHGEAMRRGETFDEKMLKWSPRSIKERERR